MRNALLSAGIAILVSTTACAGGDPGADMVATLQLDDSHDLAVYRVDEADLTPSLLVCQVAHGDRSAAEPGRCAAVDPWRWSRRSISANLDPGPTTSLLVVTHDQARFDLARPSLLQPGPPVELSLPAGPIGSLAPLTLRVVVAVSDLTADNAVGCLTTGLGAGANPVFIAAGAPPDTGSSAPTPSDRSSSGGRTATVPDDLQSACL